jgi:hypothetical protein
MPLPYENATSGQRAIEELEERKMLALPKTEEI